MTLWTKEAKEELRQQAIASTEREIDQLSKFVDTLDIENNEIHKTVALTLMSAVYELEKTLVSMNQNEVFVKFQIGEKVKILKAGRKMTDAKVGGTATILETIDPVGDHRVNYECNDGMFCNGWAEQGEIEKMDSVKEETQ